MEKIKKIIADNWINACLLVFAVFAVTVCYTLYNRSRVGTDYSDVKTTVRAVESDNREARRAVDSASAKIEHAQNQLSRSVERTDKITESVKRTKERTDGNAEIARECEDVIKASRNDLSEARTIFVYIDARNKITGAQANSD